MVADYSRPVRAEDVASYLGKSAKEVRRLAREGKIPGRKVGGVWYFNPRRIAEMVGCEVSEVVGPEGGRPSALRAFVRPL